MASIGLCMIVKDETAVIRRCLDTIRPFVDYVLIEDTGSTDGTQSMVRAWLEESGLPGTVIDEPWQDFAYNRSHAMAKLRELKHIDYILIIDADDELEIDESFEISTFKAEMVADLYDFEIRHGGIRHWRPQMCSNHKQFCFKGVLHEYIECPPGELKREWPSGIGIRISSHGARSQDPQKFQKDAILLERALQTEADPFLRSRYTFYLAQSYRDCGEREKALEAYLARAEMGFWDQEQYVALYQAGNLQVALDRPAEQILCTYERASNLCPSRIEALHAASRYCRLNNRFEDGYWLAKRGMQHTVPVGGLFIEPYIYEYGLIDELAINAYWSDRYEECVNACVDLLKHRQLPIDQYERIQTNKALALDQIRDDDEALNVSLTSTASFHICHVSLNEHDRIFDDTISAVVSSLKTIGFDCSVSKNSLKNNAVNIVIGSVLFACKSDSLSYLENKKFILYQQEQISLLSGHLPEIPEYKELLAYATVIWDYSRAGCAILNELELGSRVAYVPLSYNSALERFRPQHQQEIDVLFFGSLSRRREKILNSLRQSGYKAVHIFNVYGKDLDQIVARAKICLNIHCFDKIDTLETVRISYLLSNNCFVISETSDHNPYGNGVVYAAYDSLVETCIEYLGRLSECRRGVASVGYKTIKAAPFSKFIRAALGKHSLEALVLNGSDNMSALQTQINAAICDPWEELYSYIKIPDPNNLPHSGIDYIEFLNTVSMRIAPKSYLEIGTETGKSLRQFSCDAICIDPKFQISENVLNNRTRTFFFQMTADEFFSKYDTTVFFPEGVDIGFLDGMHHFEFLLRDFINFERYSHPTSLAILHDCLPTNIPMTSRDFRWGGWTGDVWKLLLVLRKYRPSLKVCCLDCPPTGLVVCSGLDRESNVLSENLDSIVKEYSSMTIEHQELVSLRKIYPYVSSSKLTSDAIDLRHVFGI